MRELESSLQQFAEFRLKAQLVRPNAAPFVVRAVRLRIPRIVNTHRAFPHSGGFPVSKRAPWMAATRLLMRRLRELLRLNCEAGPDGQPAWRGSCPTTSTTRHWRRGCLCGPTYLTARADLKKLEKAGAPGRACRHAGRPSSKVLHHCHSVLLRPHAAPHHAPVAAHVLVVRPARSFAPERGDRLSHHALDGRRERPAHGFVLRKRAGVTVRTSGSDWFRRRRSRDRRRSQRWRRRAVPGPHHAASNRLMPGSPRSPGLRPTAARLAASHPPGDHASAAGQPL